MAAIEFETDQYEWSMGHKPRGWGDWGFEIGGKVYFFHGSYTETKAMATKTAKAAGVRRVKVLP